MFTRKLRNILLALWFIFVVHLLSSQATALSASNEITVTHSGGTVAENKKKCFNEIFEKKYNCKVNTVIGSSTETLARLRAQKADPQIDVADMDWAVVVQAKREGLIDKLDPKKIPNLVDLYDWAKDKDGFFAGQFICCVGLTYNPQFIKEPPKTWMELWNPKYKGKITIPDITASAGYMMLLMAAKIHGGDQVNIGPGFEAIKKLKDSIVTPYTHSDQVISLFERGEVWLGVWYSDRTIAAEKKGVPVAFVYPKEGAVGLVTTVSLVKNCKNRELAEKYINILFDPASQNCYCVNQGFGPVSNKVRLASEFAEKVPYGEERLRTLYFPDYEYVSRHRGEWTERWNKEIGK